MHRSDCDAVANIQHDHHFTNTTGQTIEATLAATPLSPTAGAARQAVMAARAAAQAAARSAAVSPWGPGRRTQSGTPGGGWLAPPAGTPAAAGPPVTV